MHLRRLDLVGFKSFANRTTFLFEPGISVLCGPNGSGKSNIADAVRWALGEQSARAIRGRRGEDVIFVGSQGRQPLGLAEVSLTLDNADGRIPLDFEEVKITRRLYRSGEAEYLVNGSRVRLKDIHQWLLHAALDAEAYVVVGQGSVDELILQRPEERRVVIDNAADIRRHQVRLHETRSRLSATDENLLRCRAVIAELEPHVARLRAQAARAEKARTLGEELSRLAGRWLRHALSGARAELARARQEADAARRQAERQEAELADLEALARDADRAILAAEARVAELEPRLAAAREEIARLGREVARGEERLRGADDAEARLLAEVERQRERLAALETERTTLAGRIAAAGAAVAEAERAVLAAASADRADDEAARRAEVDLTAARRRLSALDGELRSAAGAAEDARGRIERQERRIARLTEDMARLTADVERTRADAASRAADAEAAAATLVAARARRDALLVERDEGRREMDRLRADQHRLAGERQRLEIARQAAEESVAAQKGSAAALLRGAGLAGPRGPLGGELIVPERVRRAIGAALGERAQALILDDADALEGAVTLIEECGADRAGLVVVGEPSPPSPLSLTRERGSPNGWVDSSNTLQADAPMSSGLAAPSNGQHGSIPPTNGHDGGGQRRPPAALSYRAENPLGHESASNGLPLALARERGAGGAAGRPGSEGRPAGEGGRDEGSPQANGEGFARHGRAAFRETVREMLADLTVVGVADELVQSAPELDGVRRALLGTAVVVEDLASAREAARRLGQAYGVSVFWQVVTLGGVAIRSTGEWWAGRDRQSERLVRRQAELADLDRQLEDVRARIAEVDRQAGAADARLAAAASEERALRERLAAAEAVDRKAALAAQAAAAQASRLDRELREAHAAGPSLEADLVRMRAQQRQVEARHAEAARARAEGAAAAEQAEAHHRALVSGLQERRAQRAARQAELAARRAEAQGLDALLARLSSDLESAARAVADAERRLADERRHRAEAVERATALRTELARAERAVQPIDEALASARTTRQQAREKRGAIEQRAAELRSVARAGRTVVEAATIAETRAADRLERVRREAEEYVDDLGGEDGAVQLRLNLDEAADPDVPGPDDDPTPFDPDAARRRMAALRRELRAIGDVGEATLEEFRELSERHAFLVNQTADLERTAEELRRVMDELTELMRDAFDSAFGRVNAAFSEYFGRLFAGGHAELVLSRPESVLESGVDIVARPPGKRLQPLVSLSGGERALTMVALIFALLRTNPAPFCVLDEVDAALDESNVRRFTSVLRELSDRTQFVVVSHNRATMEAAQALYGISMDTAGVSTVLSLKLPAADAPPEGARSATNGTTTT